MASFKQHCAFSFWLATIMKDPEKILLTGSSKTSMGHLGPIKSLADLPLDDTMSAYLKESMELIEQGAKLPKKKSTASENIEIPKYFLEELLKTKQAYTHFEKHSASHKKEYIQWISEAKTEATRNKRMASAIEWLKEGKLRNWKYDK
jgi:uncharacterized protein YdeI (YjbR/CyaY-like superfamily)